jgi:8-oxo-dGTP pyrophosphatase MutT (NUDIX family)
MDIPDCFYRISIKALILNETKDKFLICEEEAGTWDLPGGGFDFGATPQEDLRREIMEEMGLGVTNVSEHPSYFVTEKHSTKNYWKACILYECTLEHMDFTPSDECIGVAFVDKYEIKNFNAFPSVVTLAAMFDPEKHR